MWLALYFYWIALVWILTTENNTHLYIHTKFAFTSRGSEFPLQERWCRSMGEGLHFF